MFLCITVRGGSVLTVFLLLSRFELKIRHGEATLLKRKALGKTEPSPQNETAEVKLDAAAPAESRASDTTRPNDCPFFFPPFRSIYQQRPAGKHIKHINPQNTKYAFISGN